MMKTLKTRIRKAAEPVEKAEPEVSESLLVGAEVAADIAKLLKFSTFEPEQKYWLDTGNADLNAVFGSRERGLAYGKIIELSGVEHVGKSLLSLVIGGMAQQDGAGCGRVDLEFGQDEAWDKKHGLNPAAMVNIYPKLVRPKVQVPRENAEWEEEEATKKKKKKGLNIPYLQSAEDLFTEMEVGMSLLADKNFAKQYWIVDAVADIQTEMAVTAGARDHNMRVSLDRAAFLSYYLPRMAGLAANYSAIIFLINQVRDKQGLVFGKPTYTPGGRALRHCCSVRAEAHRVKHGLLKKAGHAVGLVGYVHNEKNKAGGGSVQNEDCGYRVRWDRDKALWTFMSKEEAMGVLS